MTTFSTTRFGTDAPAAIIDTLASRVATLCCGPADAVAAGMHRALREMLCTGSPLEPRQMQGQASTYTRHLLHADPDGRFSVVAIVWEPGQVTPVHGHYTWCGYAVVAGTLHEERFSWKHEAQALLPTGGAERRAGDMCFAYAGLEEAHQLGNRGEVQAISVHVYGIDSARVATHVNRFAATVHEPA